MPPTKLSLRSRLAGHAGRFRSALDDARGTQARRLREILTRHRECEYGRQYAFASIVDPADYARQVPIVRYEALRGAIDRMANGGHAILVSDPVVAFEETGGSTGGGKLIPYSEAALASFRRGLLPWLDDLYATTPGIDEGPAYWSISPAARAPRLTAGGLPVGLPSDAAYFGEDLATSVLATLCVPPEAALLRDVDAWRSFTVAHLLCAGELALISVWSPTFLVALLRYAQDNAEALSRCIAGDVAGTDALGAGGSLRWPRADDPRERLVREVLRANDPEWTRLWPRLAVISCWDQAAARPHAEALRGDFPGVRVQGKGLLATEGLVTLPLHEAERPVLAVDSGFFEFVDACGEARLASDVTPGEEYEVLITNDCGLYRYAIGDRVRVHGWLGTAPTLEFVGRTGVASDLCGEKLTDAFVATALAPLHLRFAMLAPSAGSRRYVLVLDAAEVAAEDASRIAAQADAALAANPQYAYARRLHQLDAVRSLRCADPLARWIDLCLRRGQRLGDIKPAAMCAGDDWTQYFPASG